MPSCPADEVLLSSSRAVSISCVEILLSMVPSDSVVRAAVIVCICMAFVGGSGGKKWSEQLFRMFRSPVMILSATVRVVGSVGVDVFPDRRLMAEKMSRVEVDLCVNCR